MDFSEQCGCAVFIFWFQFSECLPLFDLVFPPFSTSDNHRFCRSLISDGCIAGSDTPRSNSFSTIQLHLSVSV